MDNVALSRRTHTSKKGNKENTQPAHGSKAFINRNKPAAPLQAKGNKKEVILVPDEALRTKADLRSVSGVAQKNVKTAQRDGNEAPPANAPQLTHSKGFRTEQAAKFKKVAAEAPKPPAAVPPVKSAPGMYKGKVVQSKIGSIWKSSSTVSVPDLKPSEALAESRRVGMMKSRSKSVSEVAGRETRRPAQMRSKSAFDRNAQATKPSTSTRPAPPPPLWVHSARPPTRTIPATLAAPSSRSTSVIPSKAGGSQSAKLKVPVTDKRVNKPAVSSTLSQYRVTRETAEERRSKLSEWLASKGKTLKRPAMSRAAAPSKTNAKPEADLRVQSRSEEPQSAAQGEPAPEASLAAHQPQHAPSHGGNTRVAESAVHSKTPLIMNTSLELLANSDVDVLFSPEGGMDDIVVNLCEALEAMETPSGCSDENPQGTTDECNDAGMECSNPEGVCKDEEDMTEDVVEVLKEEEESDGVETEDEEEEVVCEDEGVREMPEAEEASVVKYSVKTTPYLQRFKKTLDHEASASGSKRKSNIKDLKFLTPVRRSCRIQRNLSHLPAMLVDPDPCVSSLAELVKLDDDANAFIYRKNPALLEDLPDQAKL